MRTMKISAVVLVGETDYLIHGSSAETAAEVFKAMTNGESPVWNFDPTTDIAHYLAVEVRVPELEKIDVNPVTE